MKHKAIFTADLHGRIDQYESLFETALEQEAQSVIIGGDIAETGSINPLKQELFLTSTLPDIVKTFKNKSDAEIYLILGNDDVATNLDLLEAYNGNLWNHIHGKRFSITPDYEIIGYPYIPISPFQVKDFEKFDVRLKEGEKKGLFKKVFGGDDLVQPGSSLEGEVWTGKEWVKKVFDRENIDATIEDDLNSPIFTTNPKKTIYVFHCPPYNTNLDVIPSLRHVGSKAIRQFIEKNEPYLVLSGHVHETANVMNRYSTNIGNSLAMTAGNGTNPSTLSFLVFDIYNPQSTTERNIKRLG